MGKVFEKLDDRLIAFIKAQKMFFVATAPLSRDQHVNVSPKGYDSFAVIDPLTVAYIDFGGSGIETMAHLRENRRITFMFCAFEGPAKILRLYGEADAFAYYSEEYAALKPLFPQHGRARNIIRTRLTRIADSCGWGVPFLDYKGERDQLQRYVDNSSQEEWEEHRLQANSVSIDGLPGLSRPPKTS